MGWLLFIVLIIALAAIINAGIVMSVLTTAVVAIILAVFLRIRNNAAEENSSPFIRSLANALPYILIVTSAIIFFICIVAFFVGSSIGDSYVEFTGELCGGCGGGGRLLGKECFYCKGSGYEFEYGHEAPPDLTWQSALIAVAAIVVFLVAKCNKEKIECKVSTACDLNIVNDGWTCCNCGNVNHKEIGNCQRCGVTKFWSDTHSQ